MPFMVVFFVSGVAGLVYEIVFAKELGLTFGSTSRAHATVLATYLGGLALGAALGARILARKKDLIPIRLYAGAELGVAAFCALSPFAFQLAQKLYVTFGAGYPPGAPWLTVLQVVLGGVVVLIPTVLLGMTTPALVAELESRGERAGLSLANLYAANTAGAAFGSVCTGYLFLPTLGVAKTTWLAVLLNVCAAIAALRLTRSKRPPLPNPDPDATATAADASDAPPEAETPAAQTTEATARFPVPLIILTVGGAVSLALETVDIHLLAVVAGTSAYAFSLMLFSFLLGLSGGANVARKWLGKAGNDNPARLRVGLATSQCALAFAVLATVFLWDRMSGLFAAFDGSPIVATFAARETIRFFVCLALLLPPAAAIGFGYPIAMAALADAHTHHEKAPLLARAMAWNTFGNIAGALIGTFLLLPALGSLRSLHALAAASLLLGALALFARYKPRPRRAVTAALFLPAVLLMPLQPSSFDIRGLAAGSNVYFAKTSWGKVIDWSESTDGGLTSVTIDGDGNHGIHTLLTNGKFQGNDGHEMAAQLAFSVVPLAHTTQRGRALIVGLGTGTSARILHEAGFAHAEVAELSADVLRMARKHFSTINHGVLGTEAGGQANDQTVQAHVTDGRNFLLLSKDQYDLIGIELTSIWFAGAASLYNREFYHLVASRLAPGGILQQWLQLHRLYKEDIQSVVGTLRETFPEVYLYFVGNQGVLIACGRDSTGLTGKSCAPTEQTQRALFGNPDLQDALGYFEHSPDKLLAARLLAPHEIDQLVRGALISTDDNLFLEYHTPKGNVRTYDSSLSENLTWIRSLRSP